MTSNVRQFWGTSADRAGRGQPWSPAGGRLDLIELVPGAVPASISLLESLVHGWDITTRAGLDYPADAEAVQEAWRYAATGVGDHQRQDGEFAAALPVLPTAAPLARLLPHLGRSG